MNRLTVSLLRTLGISWLGFLIVGLLLIQFATPSLVLLIDRSYCSPADWQRVTQIYEQLYRQSQQQQLRLLTVVLFSSLGQEVLADPPTPEAISSLTTYGRPDPQRLAQLKASYPQAQLLACPPR